MIRRGAAALSALGVLAHVALLATHGHQAWVAVVLAGMTLVCAGCAVKVWRTPDRRALGAVLGMSLGMAVIHVALTFGPLAGHHAGTGTPVGPPGLAGPALGLAAGGHDAAAMLAVAALDVIAGWAAAFALRVCR